MSLWIYGLSASCVDPCFNQPPDIQRNLLVSSQIMKKVLTKD